MLNALAPYRKSVTAFVSGVIAWATAVVASPASGVTTSEWLGLAVVAAIACGVYAVPNTP